MRTPHDTADSADTKTSDQSVEPRQRPTRITWQPGGDDMKQAEKQPNTCAPRTAIAGDFASHPHENGETINGRKPADIHLVRCWCRKAYAPELDDDDANHIAQQVNFLLLFQRQWRDEYAEERAKNPSILRRQRIVSALATLRAELPEAISEIQNGPRKGADQWQNLLAAVQTFDSLIDALNKPKSRGRHRSLENNVAANLSANMLKVWHGRGAKSAVNIFVAEAMAWLTGRSVKPSEDKIRKARTKRPKLR